MESTLHNPALAAGKNIAGNVSVGDGPEAWIWAAGTAVLWALSYVFWRRLDQSGARVSGFSLTRPAGQASSLADTSTMR